ncbi:MAG: type IV secretory system conjugative DNA transfer family protein, partial [Lawsonibacter sp.]|nr:type IV secretory system conjugative DNA transfer family protein [Lawsonibacter sp.]
MTNNQMPLMPLFSPVYTSTRPYSQTRSNTQRELMQPDEILRLDRRQCIALFQGHKPALLYK